MPPKSSPLRAPNPVKLEEQLKTSYFVLVTSALIFSALYILNHVVYDLNCLSIWTFPFAVIKSFKYKRLEQRSNQFTQWFDKYFGIGTRERLHICETCQMSDFRLTPNVHIIFLELFWKKSPEDNLKPPPPPQLE